MATTIEEKLKLFTKIIYDKIEEENQSELDSLEKERAIKLEELNKSLEKSREEELKEFRKKTKVMTKELLAEEKAKQKQKELILHQGMMKEVEKGVKERVDAYVKTEEYSKTLLNIVKAALQKLDKGSYTLYLTHNDLEKVKESLMNFSKELDLNLQLQETDILGGFIIEDSDRKYRIDHTLESKFLDLKDYVGMKINENFYRG
ncbi:V-type ATP synthase subunit E [Clostridium sp. N3C]|uniref:V-type ATP synthase subunit E n=1 Tax=Clostridium sp. N3C TaxID=1776758 RepID=UPI00092DEBA0|nr:V-type ATP synthase subunit E family protein [Clostridium sp. N3C]SCN21421.1 V-type ATP synthase subunit E [Clostridium sp. N3C]